MKIIAVINQKGGVGKTTTCINLSAELAGRGHRVLLVDLDPQGNSTSGLGHQRADSPTLYEILLEGVSPAEALHSTSWDNLTLIPSNMNLAGAELELASAMNREMRLKRALAPLQDRFDMALIDCPPSLGLLTVNAMAAASELLVPIQCEYYALEGLTLLNRTVGTVRDNLNEYLHIGAVLLTMYDQRLRLAQEVEVQIREAFGDVVFRTVIPRNVALAEAPSHGEPIGTYRPFSSGALAYKDLAQEVEQRWL